MQTAGANPHFLTVSIEKKCFPQSNRVILSDIQFQVFEHELAVVTGPSGCGKTTLLNIIADLDAEFTGYVARPDTDAHDLPVSYVFQDPTLLPWQTIKQNIGLINPTLAADDEALDKLLASLGLREIKNKYPRKLSLGMARRVALARAFAAHAPLLLMDEPFVSLDELTADTLRTLLLKQLQARDMMGLFVTHNLREALFLADRLIIIGGTPTSMIENIAFEKGTRGRSRAQVEELREQLVNDYSWVLG